MIQSKLGRILAVAGSVGALLAAALPQAALADKPGAHYETIIITDKGFDKPVYTIGDAGGTGDADKPSVLIINNGTIVHGVKTVPGALDEGVMFNFFKDGQGTVIPCFAPLPCGNSAALDSGGIPPGGSVSFGFDPPSLPTDYIFTSPTDCLFGNNNPNFNCTPSRIHVSDSEAGLGPLSSSMKGSWVFPVGDPMCRTDVAPVTPDNGVPFCYGKYGVPGRVVGSSKKPVNCPYTVNITDFGYDPAQVYVKVPCTITWLNTGTRVHSVKGSGAQGPGPDGFHRVDSPGLAPGESYSYTYTKFSADDPAAGSTSYSSSVGLDLLPIQYGFTKENSNDFMPHCSKGRVSCGTPLMTGKISVVDPDAPDWYHGPGSSTPTMQSYGNG
jgi:plastocyanin